jgi:DNA-binding protein HU-beta
VRASPSALNIRVCSRFFVDSLNEWMVDSAPDTSECDWAADTKGSTLVPEQAEAPVRVAPERSKRVRKQDLIKEVATEAGLSDAQATKAVNALLGAIQDALAKNQEVQISGFGSFKVVERAGREGRNPRTGEPMKIAARRSPTFKPGTQLKRTVETS